MSSPTLRRALPLAYGLAHALAFAATWLLLDRGWTGRAAAGTAIIGVAALLACACASIVVPRVPRAAFSARYALALVLLLVLGPSFVAAALFAGAVLTDIPWGEIPMRWWLPILLNLAASGVYTTLAIVGRLMLPSGLPLALLAAWLIARPR